MRTITRVKALEARLDRIEAAIRANGPVPDHDPVTEARLRSWLDRVESMAANGHAEEMTAICEIRDQLERQLTVYSDRLASLNLKVDMAHSRIERVDRLQDEIRAVQDEHGTMLADLTERLPARDFVA
jgi:ribosome-associated translation inhibitor RaiA